MAVTLTIVASATTVNGVALAAAGSRNRVIIENSDANRLHILLGSGNASATNYNFSLAQNEKFELKGYDGAIKGIWAADGTGSAFVSEFS
jgi:hypothetical protein